MSVIIKVENCYSWLITENQKTKEILWKALRFREKNYFHNPLYKRKVWDGYQEFFKIKTGRFLTGLLHHILLALKEMKIDYVIEDHRDKLNFAINEVDKNFLGNSIELYDYQVELINQAIKHKRGTIQAPTAAGKSLTMVGIIKCLPPKTPTLVVASQKTLVNQIYNDLKKWEIPNVGRLNAEHKDPNIITVSTVDSVLKLAPILPKIKVLIVDEIHHKMMAKKAKKCYEKLTGCSVRIAVSATPFKYGGKDQVQKYLVMGHFGPPFLVKCVEGGQLTTSILQEKGNLSDSLCTFYYINEPQLVYEIFQDAVTRGIAENIEFHKTVTRLTGTLKGRTIIFVERIVHGDILSRMIPNSLWVQGKDNDETREHVIKQLSQSKECIAIATHGIFNAGVNFFCNNLINAAGGKADHQIIQRMGRGLRTADDKEQLRYFDFVFNINEYLLDHSLQRIKILEKEKHKIVIKETLDF